MANGKGGKGGAAKMVRFDTVPTPKGPAGFSYLREPDEKFGAKQRIQIFVDPKSEETKKFVATLLATKSKYLTSVGAKSDGKVPGLKKADAYMAEKFGEKFGVKEGDLYFEFTTNARKNDAGDWIFVPMYDAQAQQNDNLRVFAGDVVRASVTLMGYSTGKEKGIKAYLNSVQVITKNSTFGGAVNVFGVEADGNTGGDAGLTSAESGDQDGGEEAPFEVEGDAPAPVAVAPATGKKAKTTKATAKAEEPAAPSEGGEVDLSDLV